MNAPIASISAVELYAQRYHWQGQERCDRYRIDPPDLLGDVSEENAAGDRAQVGDD